MQLRCITTTLLLLFGLITFGQIKIAGTVSDKTTGEYLYGATVYDRISGKGAVSNNYGYFIFTTDSSEIDLAISFVGYQTQYHKGRSVYSTELSFPLASSIELKTVEITADKKEITPLAPMGVKMTQKFIKHVPAFLGENDVLRSAQFIPGVQSAGDGATGLVVRGGSPDQNLILLDGVPVYNAFHVMGLFSVFNPEMIQNTYILKGAFPARYSGRLSSVLDIQTKEGSKEKRSGSVGISPLVSHLFLEGPVDKEGKGTFTISGRRTFIDVLTAPFIYAESDGEAMGGFHFHDFNAKYNYRLDSRNQLFFSVYSSKDRFGFRTKERGGSQQKGSFGWGNTIAMFRWNKRYSSGMFMNLNAYYSRYRFSTGFEFKEPDDYSKYGYFSGIEDFSVKANWETTWQKGILRFGGQLIHHEFNPGLVDFEGSLADIEFGNINGFKLRSVEMLSFIEWEKAWGKHFKTNVGINNNLFQADSAVYIYPDPRVKLSYLQGRAEYFVAFSSLTQTLHLLTNPAISLPTDLWIPSTGVLKPSRAQQVSLGYKTVIADYQIEVGTYYKQMQNLVEVKEGEQIFVLTDNWQDKIAQGQGYSYGMELSIMRSFKNLDLSFGATYSRSLRKVEDINNDEVFPYKYDRPLYVTQTGLWNFSENKSFSWAFTLASGYRFTAPIGSFESGSPDPLGQGHFYRNTSWLYSDRNGVTMPIYHRLDLAFETRKAKKRGERIWKFGLTNAYNRVNPVVLDTYGMDLSKSKKVTGYGVVPILPSIKWTRTF